MAAWLRAQRRWLVVERLPVYAPDLNPVELVWGNLKARELANSCPGTIAEAEVVADEGLCRSGAEAELRLSFLRHTGLEL
jgi:transposase